LGPFRRGRRLAGIFRNRQSRGRRPEVPGVEARYRIQSETRRNGEIGYNSMGMHGFILHNGKIKEAAMPGLFAGQLGLLAGWGVFTTLRVSEGALFAWERHWARMSRDARLLNVEMPGDPDRVEHDLINLIERNHAQESTARLVVVRNGPGFWEGPSSGE